MGTKGKQNVELIVKKFTELMREIGFNAQVQQNVPVLEYKELFRRSNEFVLKDKNLKNSAIQIGLGTRRKLKSKNPRMQPQA